MARILILDGVATTLAYQRGKAGEVDGHEIYWYSPRVDDVRAMDLAGFAQIPSRRFSGRIRRIARVLDPLHLAFVIRRFRIDLIHAHNAFQELLVLGIPRNMPLVVSTMGGDIMPDQGFVGRWRPTLIRMMLRRADVITVKSAFMREAVKAIDPSLDPKVEEITWGIDSRVFRPGLDVSILRSRHNIPEGTLVFFDLRLADPFYRKHVIMEAYAGLPDEIARKSVLMVAEYGASGNYVETLKDLAKSLGIMDRVRFVGTVSHAEMPLYINLADVGVGIPPSDGLPQSLYEMMACGTYPIMGALPQYAELLTDGINAHLIPMGTEESMRTALVAAMTRVAGDPVMRRTVAIQNREKVLQVADKEDQVRRLMMIYRQLLDRSTKARHERATINRS